MWFAVRLFLNLAQYLKARKQHLHRGLHKQFILKKNEHRNISEIYRTAYLPKVFAICPENVDPNIPNNTKIATVTDHKISIVKSSVLYTLLQNEFKLILESFPTTAGNIVALSSSVFIVKGGLLDDGSSDAFEDPEVSKSSVWLPWSDLLNNPIFVMLQFENVVTLLMFLSKRILS